MGERTPLALIDAPASGRMAVGEAITNIAAARDRAHRATSSCRRTGWRAAGHPGEDAALYDTVRAVAHGAVPRARHLRSRSARTRCRCARRGATTARQGGDRAAVADRLRVRAGRRRARATLTPQLRRDAATPSCCSSISARASAASAARRWRRSTASSATTRPTSTIRRALAAFFDAIQELHARGPAARLPRPSPTAASFATLCEMAFASRCGLDIALDAVGARSARRAVRRGAGRGGAGAQPATRGACSTRLAAAGLARRMRSARPAPARPRSAFAPRRASLLDESRVDLHRAWSETTHAMQRLRDNPECADEEYARLARRDGSGPARRAHVRPGRGHRRAVHRDAARGRASRSCASRASTARSRWRRRSTAPASTPSTCT